MNKLIDLKNIDGLLEADLNKKLKDDISKNRKIEIIFQHRTILVFIDGIFSYKGEFLRNSLKLIEKKSISLFKTKSPKNVIGENIKDVKDVKNFNIF